MTAAVTGDAPSVAGHPRLLFGPAEVPALRAKIRNEPHKSMYERLAADAETGDRATGTAEGAYGEATAAHRCAFLYVLTGDDGWARRSRGYVEQRVRSRDWADRRLKGLTLYYVGKSVALAYDWCHGAPSWEAAFAETVSEKLREQAEAIFEHGGTEQNRDPASNWQGLRFSAAGLCYLATDEPYEAGSLGACYDRVVRYLRENLGPDPGSRGWNIEGLGYTYYPMANGVCPFGIAMARRDPARDLREAVPAARYTLWTCFAAMVTTRSGRWRPDFGDDNPGTDAEGALGFAFHYCPPELRPGLKYWYDRTVGTKGDGTFDSSRFGTASSILYYPGDAVAERDPMSLPAWRALFLDTGGNGFFTWRNRYKDNDDLVAQVYVKRRGNRGHSGPDALSFRIVGLDTLWAVGGGRYGPKLGGQHAYLRSMNTLYPVDPDATLAISGHSGRVVGTPLVREDGGGHLACAIDVNNLGVRDHTRRFVADYSGRSGVEAVYIIADTSENGAFWQLCTLETNAVTTEGSTFTITGPTGSTLRGTVLYPVGPPFFRTGTRIRGSSAGKHGSNNFVHFRSEDGCCLVVLTVAKRGQPHPRVAATGAWRGRPRGTVTVGSFSVAIDDEIRYP